MVNDKNPERPVQNAATQPIEPAPVPDMERIYRDHASRVMSAAYRVTGSASDAEDVLQTVFMRLVRREGGSHLDQNPAAYLHRAAVNASLDLIRSRRATKQSWQILFFVRMSWIFIGLSSANLMNSCTTVVKKRKIECRN